MGAARGGDFGFACLEGSKSNPQIRSAKPHRSSAFVFGRIFCMSAQQMECATGPSTASHCVVAAGMGRRGYLHLQSMEFELRTTREIHT